MRSAVSIALIALAAAIAPCHAADESRQELIRKRSADVMPFDLKATTHIFTKTMTGGVQRVVARDPDDTKQIELIRAHLREIADEFRLRDFSGPLLVHGAAMPGLAALQAAPAGELRTGYRDVASGGEVEYSSTDPKIVDALHQWFDAQLVDHGADAMPGHDRLMQHPQ